MLPQAYILAVSVYMNVFLRNLNGEGKGPAIPPLKLSLEFYDIAIKRHKVSYEMEFQLEFGTHYAFKAEIVPKRA